MARNLSMVGTDLIGITPDRVIDLSRGAGAAQNGGGEGGGRETSTSRLIARFADDLAAGNSITARAEGNAVAAVPVVFGPTTIESFDDNLLLVAVARRPLGAAGLGPLGPGLLLTMLVALAASLALAEALARRIRGPLLAVSETSRQIASGNLDARVALPESADEEVAQIGSTIDALAEQLAMERDNRQRFLLDMSHELRTPLTSVRGHAELLAEEPPASLTAELYAAEVTESGRVIERESIRMERLIEDLLDLSRFESGQTSVNTTAVDVAVAARETASALRTKAESRGVSIVIPEPDVPAIAQADRMRLDQVITNLVSNAIDFATSTVEITSTSLAAHIVLSVTDDGPGLGDDPEQFLERHRRGAQPSDRNAGLGIGLSIVETFVTAMSGTVIAANSEHGAVFTVTLPRA